MRTGEFARCRDAPRSSTYFLLSSLLCAKAAFTSSGQVYKPPRARVLFRCWGSLHGCENKTKTRYAVEVLQASELEILVVVCAINPRVKNFGSQGRGGGWRGWRGWQQRAHLGLRDLRDLRVAPRRPLDRTSRWTMTSRKAGKQESGRDAGKPESGKAATGRGWLFISIIPHYSTLFHIIPYSISVLSVLSVLLVLSST